MLANGESQKEVIRPNFNRANMIDFQGATISSDVVFLLVREIDERFKIFGPIGAYLKDLRSPAHTNSQGVFALLDPVFHMSLTVSVSNFYTL